MHPGCHYSGFLLGDTGLRRIHTLLLDDNSGIGPGAARTTVRDALANKIAALIASGLLKPGDELPGERDLAAALAVSRETVRLAIQMLAARGILAVSHGARTKVLTSELGDMAVGITRQIDVNRYAIEDVHAARLLLEQQAAGLAAHAIGADDLELLARVLETQQLCLADPLRFLIADREFHLTIYRACGNPLLADMVTDLYNYMLDYRRRIVSQADAIRDSIADHRAILTALQDHDAAAARQAFARHEDRIYTTTRLLLTSEAGAD